MSDLINRQQAIDVLEEQLDYLFMLNKKDNPTAESKWHGVNWARNTIAELPSAEPLVTVKAKQNEGLYLDTDEETLLETEYIVVATDGWYKEYIHETDGKPRVGKWIAVDSDDMCYDHYKCSNCLCEISVDSKRICDVGFTIEDFDYCLQCGAKMERSE